jgi:biopolymer transport protein ExbB
MPLTFRMFSPARWVAAALILSSLAFQPRAQVQVNEQTEKLEALKQELEAARQMRDKVIAKRWEDRQKDNEARDKFNQEYDDLKNKLELKSGEADRMHEEIQSLIKDAEEAEAEAENARVQYAILSGVLRDRIGEMSAGLGKAFPAKVAERQEKINQLLKDAEVKKDAPAEVVNALLAWFRDELALTRESVLEKREFVMADRQIGEGLLLRVGTVASAYKDDKTGKVGLLLKGTSNAQVTPWQWHENLPEADRQALGEALASLSQNPEKPVLLPGDILMSQGKANAYTESPKMTLWEQFRHMIKTGGVFMWPLLVIPLVVIYLFGLKLYVVMGRRGGSKKQFEAVIALAQAGKAKEAYATAQKISGSLVASTLATVSGIADASRGAAEKALKELLLFEVPRLERHLTTLSVLAAAAPLLGLLGTVSGLITMFQVITEYGVNDPKLLAGGIGEALIATETGLLVAIPTLMGHNWLANRVDQTVSEAEAYGHKMLNTLWPEGKA